MKIAPSISIIADRLELHKQVLNKTTCKFTIVCTEMIIKELETIRDEVIAKQYKEKEL